MAHTDDSGTPEQDATGTGPTAGKDPTSFRTTYEPEQDVPATGVGPSGAADPAETAADPQAASLERLSAFYGAEADEPEAPESPPFSSAVYPASSEPTGLTHRGDEVVGLEDGPSQGLTDSAG